MLAIVTAAGFAASIVSRDATMVAMRVDQMVLAIVKAAGTPTAAKSMKPCKMTFPQMRLGGSAPHCRQEYEEQCRFAFRSLTLNQNSESKI